MCAAAEISNTGNHVLEREPMMGSARQNSVPSLIREVDQFRNGPHVELLQNVAAKHFHLPMADRERVPTATAPGIDSNLERPLTRKLVNGW